MNSPQQSDESISKEMLAHLGRVADIIFALAMAQCILIFQEPETAKAFTDQEIVEFLFAQLKPLSAYTVAFIVVGFYWIEHIKRFKHYQKTNETHFWLQLLYLMGMFLIPYSNTLIMYFSENAIVKACVSLNIAFVGFLAFISWIYATHQHRLISPDLDKKTIGLISYHALIEPVFSMLTIGVLFVNESWWDYVWFLLPIPYILIDKLFNRTSEMPSETPASNHSVTCDRSSILD